MALPDDLRKILHQWSVDRGRLVVAVSGGADSTALLHALAEACPDLELISAHVNHELRGDESERDAITVENHGRALGIECVVVRAPLDPEMIRRQGVEAAARGARYDALHAIREQTGAEWIATGHTMDDQAETVLQKLITRTPVESLRGIIPRTSSGVIRPLLGLRRRVVHDWLHDRDIPHRFDSSNEDFRFLRNRIRHVLIPELESKDPHVVEHLAAIADHVGAIRQSLVPIIRRVSAKWDRTPRRSRLPLAQLPQNRSLRRIVLLDELRRLAPEGREISSERLASLPEELVATSRLSLGEGIDAMLDGDVLVLQAVGSDDTPEISQVIHCGETVTLTGIGASVTLRRVDGTIRYTDEDRHVQVFALPAGTTAEEPFLLRNRRRGDRFQPLGMDHPKKLKDVLIDRKVPRVERDAIPLLIFRNEIVWIAGVEVSERFRVSPGRDLYEVRIDYERSEIGVCS